MDASQIVTLIIAAGSALGVILAYFKYKPGQRQQVDMTIAQANMNVAQGTFQLVTTELEDQFKRMSADAKTLREEFDQYRREVATKMDDMANDLSKERAEKSELKRERDSLLRRVETLEDEIRMLKGRGAPT